MRCPCFECDYKDEDKRKCYWCIVCKDRQTFADWVEWIYPNLRQAIDYNDPCSVEADVQRWL